MPIIKLVPSCKNYLWGGRRLIDEFNINFDGAALAEAWSLSCHEDGPSTIAGGNFHGKTLAEYIELNGKKILGENCRRFKKFPLLIKFIDARENLSVQVHPNNDYALKNENQLGKDEFWYILDAKPGAFIYYGVSQEISKKDFAQHIAQNTLPKILNAVEVKRGDTFFIKAGTIHSVSKGILLAEIQQNSNVSYRIFDYNRVGADGKPRTLHIKQSLDVANLKPVLPSSKNYPHLVTSEYFTVDKLNLDGKILRQSAGFVDEKTFLSILILDGNGKIFAGDEEIFFSKGDSFFLPANTGAWKIFGQCDALLTYVGES